MACGDASVADTTSEVLVVVDEVPLEQLEGPALLARISLDLVGRRPTLDELDRYEGDADELDALIEEYLADPAFAERMGWLWNDAFHTAVFAEDYRRFDELPAEVWQAMGWEPLAMVALVVDRDLDFSALVTSQQTAANGALASFYPVDYEGEDWGWADYDDGRPMAGALSSTTLWLRYSGDATNYNRARANAASRIFLCGDFLERDGGFEFALDPDVLNNVEHAVTTEGACLTCHAALDPLATAFGGFAELSDSLPAEQYLRWSAQTDAWYSAHLPPAYFGLPATLEEMGPMMAADPRFARCAVQRFHEGLVGAPPDAAEHAVLTADFVGSGMVARELVRDIVASEVYREVTPRLLTTEQLHGSLSTSLGLSFDVLEPLLWEPEMRVLAGGTDDVVVLEPNLVPAVGREAALLWAAREGVPESTIVDNSAPVEDEVARLVRVFLSVEDPETIDGLVALQAAYGWDAVLEALVRHPLGGSH